MATGRVPTTANSPLTAKGDLFTYSTAPARLAVGNNGESLVADSAATTGLRYSATPSASNPVINSAFQVWQRGTSISLSASSSVVYTSDRWCINTNASQACTVSRQTTSDTTNLPFIQYAARVQRNSGQTGTGIIYFAQTLETVNSIPFFGKTVTVSFYARAGANYSPTSSTLSGFIVSGTTTDGNVLGSFAGQTTVATTAAALTTTWQRFTMSGTVGSTVSQLAVYFANTPTGTAGVNDYYEVTGVQIDIGSVALPFRTYAATIQGELAACQRYYVRLGANNGGTTGAYSTYGNGYSTQTTDASINITLPTTMRIPPTVCEFSNLAIQDFNTAVIAVSNVTLNSTFVSTTVAVVAATTVGATQFRGCKLSNNNNTAGYVGFSAEL
jgi:hypothetical protein